MRSTAARFCSRHFPALGGVSVVGPGVRGSAAARSPIRRLKARPSWANIRGSSPRGRRPSPRRRRGATGADRMLRGLERGLVAVTYCRARSLPGARTGARAIRGSGRSSTDFRSAAEALESLGQAVGDEPRPRPPAFISELTLSAARRRRKTNEASGTSLEVGNPQAVLRGLVDEPAPLHREPDREVDVIPLPSAYVPAIERVRFPARCLGR